MASVIRLSFVCAHSVSLMGMWMMGFYFAALTLVRRDKYFGVNFLCTLIVRSKAFRQKRA